MGVNVFCLTLSTQVLVILRALFAGMSCNATPAPATEESSGFWQEWNEVKLVPVNNLTKRSFCKKTKAKCKGCELPIIQDSRFYSNERLLLLIKLIISF